MTLEVIDIYQQPGLTKDEQIVAAPTLVEEAPGSCPPFGREFVQRRAGVTEAWICPANVDACQSLSDERNGRLLVSFEGQTTRPSGGEAFLRDCYDVERATRAKR